jgi:hypothetical protein
VNLRLLRCPHRLRILLFSLNSRLGGGTVRA